MRKFSAVRILLWTIFPQYLIIPLYEFVSKNASSYEKVLLCNMYEEGDAAAKEDVEVE
jgi:hypothetical protein